MRCTFEPSAPSGRPDVPDNVVPEVHPSVAILFPFPFGLSLTCALGLVVVAVAVVVGARRLILVSKNFLRSLTLLWSRCSFEFNTGFPIVPEADLDPDLVFPGALESGVWRSC